MKQNINTLNHFIFLICCLLIPATVTANDNLKLSIGQWSFDDLNAQNLNIELSLTAEGLGFTASADSVQLAQAIGKLTHVNLNCKELLIVSEKYSCARGDLAFHQQEIGSQKLQFEIEAHPANEKYKVEIDNINVASALFSATFMVKHDK